ncbi:serine-rich coiled-coil domain-containing protein 2 isoform X1 [Megalobrama amblycephala]|uniref:serine-rich coiled-coil domain-containing protein 2 isoform X1 n=1 Tax=Megalobrama amblycephala TaxID=75352 RepID=UPI0020141895|nr:serine-rich coiled-coil domain-containing protein 2 isoform X1 [Megalobrama amblycephala]XP_048047288.1 serine-rich coiled-coil domain-containing protein 2 isoform X1 [Megalobrama amblycephala]
MEQKVLSKSSMVSRLPKFGARPVNGTSSPLPNGTQTTLTQESKNPPARPNGVVRASSFSMKWRKDSGGLVDPSNPVEGGIPEEKKEVRSQHSPGNRELKSPSTSATKVRRSASSLSTGSPKPVAKSPKSIPSPKPKPQNTQITTTSKSQDISQKGSSSKPTQNGTSSLGPSTGQAAFLGLQRPRANSSSTRSTSKDSLSQSNDSLSRQSVVPDYMVRSQSFTHFKQLPSPTSSPMTRSFSFNKAVELAKPLANTQLRPPRTLGLKSPLTLSKGRLVLGLGGLGFGKGSTDRLPAGTPPSESLTPPNSIKRPLLLNSVLTKHSLQAYRLNRPTAAKPQCPLVVGRSPVESDGITPPLTPELPHCATKSTSASIDSPEEPVTEPGSDGNLRYTGDGTEDMSLSSASSLERNDTSEEFLDDFDNLGDQSQNGILHNKNPLAIPTQMRMQSFLNETMDWTGIGLAVGKADLRGGVLRGPPLMSPDVDRHATSSLELSPSNSSGGTYMWDEEGMEPLGQNTHIHRCSSYESDLNSIDVLNHLDNTGSCDLEDDDLMLDVDLPEDGALHNDGMAHFERSDRGGRPTQWRRRQQRWSGMDHAHNDNRLAGFHYDACRTGHRPLQPTVQHDSHTVVLDELTLKHVAEDCSSVKSQLLKLKSLLQMDDGEITPEGLDSSEDDSRAKQMEELMKEVAHLREELKNKDKIITRLTHQQHQESPVRCQCHQLKSGAKGERRTHHDKSTQTVWRPPHHHPAPRILQPISHFPNEPLMQGKLARTVPTGGHNDACTEGEQTPTSCPPVPCTDPILPPFGDPHVESKSLPDPEELSWLLSTHLRIQDNESNSQEAGEQIARPTPESRQKKLLQTPHTLSFSPRFLQPPRLHKRVTLPALHIGGSSGSNPKPGPSVNHMSHQLLPPPSRGLPCYSAGNHVVTRGRLSQPWPAVVRREADPEHNASVPLGISTRLAKPKNH